MAHKIVLKDGKVVGSGGLEVARGRDTGNGRFKLIIVVEVPAQGEAEIAVLKGTEYVLLTMAADRSILNAFESGQRESSLGPAHPEVLRDLVEGKLGGPPLVESAGQGSDWFPHTSDGGGKVDPFERPPLNHPDGGRRGD